MGFPIVLTLASFPKDSEEEGSCYFPPEAGFDSRRATVLVRVQVTQDGSNCAFLSLFLEIIRYIILYCLPIL